jgi:hypothetical protein
MQRKLARRVAFLAAQGYIGPISRIGLFQWCASEQHGQLPPNAKKLELAAVRH